MREFFYKRCVFLCGCCPKNVLACRMPVVISNRTIVNITFMKLLLGICHVYCYVIGQQYELLHGKLLGAHGSEGMFGRYQPFQ